MPLRRLMLVAMLVSGAVSTARAQPRPSYAPSSTHIFPAGGRRGTTLKVLVGAECIPPQTRFRMFGKGVHLSSPGFEKSRETDANEVLLAKRIASKGEPSPRRKPTIIPITIPREWAAAVSIDGDAPPGTVFWRLSCAQGGTELRPFVVGELPEFIETESNSTPQTAEKVSLPVTVNGRIFGERDNDYFRFSARRGEVVVCEVLAARLKSRLDPIVEMFTADGTPVSVETLYVQNDPVLAFRAETAGDYLLRMANVSHHGDPAHVYRLNLSTRPWVRSAFPASGTAGSEREIAFSLMSGTGKPRIVKRKVRFPKTGTSFSYRLSFGRDSRSSANAVTLAVTDHSCITEADDVGSSRGGRIGNPSCTTLNLPQTVDGRFASPRDEDWFAFRAEKGAFYAVDCEAPESGSAALPTLLLTDAAGKRLQFVRSLEADDRRCRLNWQAPAAGTYRIRVRDQQFGAKGGREFLYRLTVKPAEPDFELAIPSESINLVQGKEVDVPLFVKHYGAFDEPIALSVEGLPDGVKVKPKLITGQRDRYDVTLKAAKNTPCGDARIRFVGRARAGLRKLVHAARPRSLPQSDAVHLTIQHRPLFRLYCAEAYQYAHRGSVFMYPMTVERLDGFAGEVVIQEGDRQNRDMDGIEIGTVKVPPMQTEFRVPIYLPETMHINVQSQSQLYSQAYAFFKDERGRRQSLLVLSEKRNMIRTLPPVVKLKAAGETVTAKPGGTVRVRLLLERTTNFPGAMTVALRPPAVARGFTVESLKFRPGQTEAAAVLHLPKESAARPVPVTFRATGRMKDGTVIISEATVRVVVLN